MGTYVRVFMALSLGMVFPGTTRTQDFGNTLDKIYRDETHCLVGAEIRKEKDNPVSCYCRDALTDARYVYQTYLTTGKDRNLNGTFLRLEVYAARTCGEGYNVLRAAEDADWRWNGPEVIRKYPPDSEIQQLKPDSDGWRSVKYKVELVYRDPPGRPVSKVESFTAVERFPPKDWFPLKGKK